MVLLIDCRNDFTGSGWNAYIRATDLQRSSLLSRHASLKALVEHVGCKAGQI